LAQKILVIRFSSIGDIVLTTPVVRALHLQLGADVHFLTKPQFSPILLPNPHVSKVIMLTENFDDMIGELKAEKYDYIIDLHHNLRTQRIKLALRRPSSSFPKLNFEKWLLVRFHINRLPDIHIVQRYFAATRKLGIKNDGKGLDFFIPAEKKVDVFEKFGIRAGQYACIVIGATYVTKTLTSIQIAKLCDNLNMPVVLLGGKDETSKAESILSLASIGNAVNACGKFDIQQSASILEQSATIITHDTGLMHIAAALKKPQVVVWGNTIPQFGMYPYYGTDDIRWISFEQKDLNCRPCTKLGFDQCPKGHFKCILDHDINEIAIAAKKLIIPID
jgi:ADP-heptose:LPS heptosyltransferase